MCIHHWRTGYEPLHLKGKWQSTIPLHLSSGSQHCHREESPISILRICHCTTAYVHLHRKWNADQQFHLVWQPEVNITTEQRLQFWHATIQQVMPILPLHRHILDYPGFRHRATCYLHLSLTGKWWSYTLFVEWKSTTPWRSVSNFDTDRITPDWHRVAANRNWQRSSWLEQYLQYSIRQVLQVCLYVPPRHQSRYNRTVCHHRRRGWLEVMTVEVYSTID